MSTIEACRPFVHRKIHATGIGFSSCWRQSRVFTPNPSQLLVNSPSFASRGAHSLNISSKRFSLWQGFVRSKGLNLRNSKILAKCSDGGGDSAASSGEKSEASTRDSSTSDGPNKNKEKQRKEGSWWWPKGGKGMWQPKMQVHLQGFGFLLLQLGVYMAVMRLLRLEIPLQGSDPMTPVTYTSVPYSEFLNRIDSNQVKNVQIDGAHIVFKLKLEPGHELGTTSASEESESLLRAISPTKRIVYTTTRPSDIKTPYEKMVENQVEFGSPDKRSSGFWNSALVSSNKSFYFCYENGLS